jgi:membrane-associated phospholipid phosphatase
MTERRLRPTERLPFLILGVGLAAASFVGTARVMAGRHFITDSIGGAIVGTSVGVLVPALHGSPVRVVPNVAPKQGAITFVGVF